MKIVRQMQLRSLGAELAVDFWLAAEDRNDTLIFLVKSLVDFETIKN